MKEPSSRTHQSNSTLTGHTPDPFQPRPFAPVSKDQPPLNPISTAVSAEPSFLNFSISDPGGTSRQPVQPKLTIGAPGDKYEQEADRVAAQVVQRLHATPSPPPLPLQRQAVPTEEAELQLKPTLQRQSKLEITPLYRQPFSLKTAEPSTASADLESTINHTKGQGQSLDFSLQQRMGSVMGADFSNVTIHTDTQSDQLNRSIQAKAFTEGQDIFFRQGTYQPGSRNGQELIAHELTHVLQQDSGNVQRKEHLDWDTQQGYGTKYRQSGDFGKTSSSISENGRYSQIHSVDVLVQRKLIGKLDNANREQAHKGLRQYKPDLKYGEANDALQRLKELREDVDSWELATILLWPDSEAAANARVALEKNQKKKVAEDAENALKQKVADLYPERTGAQVYRGDNRTWDEILAPDEYGNSIGFRAKNPLSIEDARAQVKTWFAFGADPKAYHEAWIRNPAAAGGDKIATGTELNCMGYGIIDPMVGANSNVYMIDTPDLTEIRSLTHEVLGVAPVKPVTYSTGPKLLLNAKTVDEATVIAVRGAGNAGGETTFFTAINPSWIKLIYEATKWKSGEKITADRQMNQANREKSGRWVDDDVHAAHATAKAAKEALG